MKPHGPFKTLIDSNQWDFNSPLHTRKEKIQHNDTYTHGKNLFSGFCELGGLSPINLWCRLLQQAQTILNLLLPEISNPNLSSHMELEGIFDFNRKTWPLRALKLYCTKKQDNANHWIRTIDDNYRVITLFSLW